MKTILETERLILREMTEHDADNLFALSQNPKLTRFIPGEPPLTNREDARVVGKAMPDNHASIRVLEKIGLVFEGKIHEDGCELAVYVMNR